MSRKIGVAAVLAALVAATALAVGGGASAAGVTFKIRPTLVACCAHVGPGDPVEYRGIAVNLSSVAAHVVQVVFDVVEFAKFAGPPSIDQLAGGVCWHAVRCGSSCWAGSSTGIPT